MSAGSISNSYPASRRRLCRRGLALARMSLGARAPAAESPGVGRSWAGSLCGTSGSEGAALTLAYLHRQVANLRRSPAGSGGIVANVQRIAGDERDGAGD